MSNGTSSTNLQMARNFAQYVSSCHFRPERDQMFDHDAEKIDNEVDEKARQKKNRQQGIQRWNCPSARCRHDN